MARNEVGSAGAGRWSAWRIRLEALAGRPIFRGRRLAEANDRATLRRGGDRSDNLHRHRVAADAGRADRLLAARAQGGASRPAGRLAPRLKFVVPPLGGCVSRRRLTNSLKTFFIESRDSATSRRRGRP